MKMRNFYSVLLLMHMLVFEANAFTQDVLKRKITLSVTDMEFRNILTELEQKADIKFVYSSETVQTNPRETYHFKDRKLADILDELLQSKGLHYEVSGYDLIILRKKQAIPLPVKGKVTDESGKALVGVTVKIKNLNVYTTTDAEGNFTIQAEENSVLVFSFVGYKTLEVGVNGRSSLEVKMQTDEKALDEVVVIGYGQVRRRDVTGAISTIKPKPEDAVQFNSVDALLRGRAAGVAVQQQSAQPGGILSVRIRGTNSLRNDNEPLYVVDGIIISSATEDTKNPNGSTINNDGVTQQNGLTGINPQDIESIEILKDASATAIYGSRGANGVVLITTKQGRAGSPSIQLNINNDFSWTTKYLDVLNGYEYAQFRNDLSALNGRGPIYNKDTIQPVDWQRDVQRTGVSRNYRLSVTGGSRDNKTKYYLAGGLLDVEGIIYRTGSKQGDVKFNLTQELSNRLSINFSVSGITRTNNQTTTTEPTGSTNGSIISQMLQSEPLINAASNLDDPDLAFVGPRSYMNDYDDISKEQRVLGNLGISYKISKTFTYRLNLAGDYRHKTRSRYFGLNTFPGRVKSGTAGLAELDRTYYLVENLLMFNKNFNTKHRINGTVGVTYDNTFLSSGNVAGDGFFDQSLRSDGIGFAQVLYPYVLDKSSTELFSVLARLNYSLLNRYIVTLTARADGSSKFAEGNRFSYFPALAFAWLVHQEKFMQNVTAISSLKLRTGYGATGNQGISPYETFGRYNSTQYASGNTPVTGTTPGNIANPELKWETTRQFNAGIDIGILKDRISVNVDAYHKKTVDLLQSFQVPRSAGFYNIMTNKGSLENKGIEFSINATAIQKKNFSLTAGMNMSFNRNKILDLELPVALLNGIPTQFKFGQPVTRQGTFNGVPANIFVVGQPLGLFYGYKTNGIYQTIEETQGERINGAQPRPGDIRLVDINGDKVITPADRTYLGDPNPDFTFGFNIGATYKRFSLSIFLNGSYGNDLVNATEANLSNTSYTTNVLKEYYFNAWTSVNPSDYYPRINYTVPYFTDRMVEDASFIRLSTVTLSYSQPLKNSKVIKSIAFNVTGRNLALITSYRGFDPEVNSFGYDINRMGIDLNSYPNARGVTFGANFIF